MSVSEPKPPLLERYFRLAAHGTTPRKEIIAGITTFVTMAYGFLLIPTMLASIGVDMHAAMTATVIAGIYSTLLCGLWGNAPFAVAPGIALIVYLTSVVAEKGAIAWPVALGLCFLTGLCMWILTTLRLRTLLVETIPHTLRVATVAGIGMFLAIVGLKHGGILIPAKHFYTFGPPLAFPNIMTAVGIIFIALLLRFRVYGALFWGILLVWIISAFMGAIEWNGLFALPHSLSPTLFQVDVHAALHPRLLEFLISMIFIGLFDSTAAVLALSSRAKMLEEKGGRTEIHWVHRIFTTDATGTMLGSILGTSPNAFYLEAAAGIGVGGRTGLTAVVTAALFSIMLFLSPFITTIPFYATAPVLIIVGGMMLKSIGEIDWHEFTEWLPAFLTLLLIPITFDIALGIGVGYITYCTLKLITGKIQQVHIFTWIIATLFTLKFLLL